MENNLSTSSEINESLVPAPAEKKKMKLWKKILLGLGILIVVVALGIYFLPKILTLLFPGDAILVNDSEVRLQKVEVPDSDNGFYDFSKIDNCNSENTDHCNSLINIPKGFDDLAYTNYVKPAQWNQQLVDEVLQNNQQALDLFSQASNKKYFQIPDYADPENLGYNIKIYPLNFWRQIARLQAIKALSLSRAGKYDEALQEAVKINKVGHSIVVGHNALIGALVGMAIQQLGSQTILHLLPYGNPSKQVLSEVQAMVNQSSDNTEGYKDAFRFEYTNVVKEIDQLITEKLDDKIQQMVQDGTTDKDYANYVKYGYYYKPNQTKNLYENLYSQEVVAIGVDCEINNSDIDDKSAKPIVPWKFLFTENFVGKLLFSETGVVLSSPITKGCQNDLAANVAQIQLALKQYQIDNGILPSSLDVLVPQYLSRVPLDPFDKQPIRYLAQNKIVYSVGLNKKDLGGSSGEDWTTMENPTFKIGF